MYLSNRSNTQSIGQIRQNLTGYGLLPLGSSKRERKKVFQVKARNFRSKDATRGSWPCYWEQEATSNKGHRY